MKEIDIETDDDELLERNATVRVVDETPSLSFEGAPASCALTSRVYIAQITRTFLRWTALLFMGFSLIQAILGMHIFLDLLGRRFVYFPFALACLINFFVASNGAGVFRRRSSLALHLFYFSASLVWLIVSTVLYRLLTDAFFTSSIISEGFFEDTPDRPLNENWASVYHTLSGYFSLVTFTLILLGLICFAHLILCFLYNTPSLHSYSSSKIHSDISLDHSLESQPSSPSLSSLSSSSSSSLSSLSPSPSSTPSYLSSTDRVPFMEFFVVHRAHQPTVRLIGFILFSLIVCILLVFFFAGLLDLASSFTTWGYCDPQNPSCYSHCDPIDPTECLYPFPNSFYEIPDPASSSSSSSSSSSDPLSPSLTGLRLSIPMSAFPQQRAGYAWTNGQFWNELDGWSTVGPILFYLPDASEDGLPTHDRIADSLLPDCPVVLVDTSTGLRVPIFVELDRIDPASPSLIIQPARALPFATRFVVGVRRLRAAASAQTIPPSLAMQALVRGQYLPPFAGISAARHQRFHAEVLPFLSNQSFALSEIQLAWDFTTASRDNLLLRAVTLRDDAFARHARGEVTYAVSSVEEGDCSDAVPWNRTRGRVIWGSVRTPLYLSSGRRLAPFDRSAASPGNSRTHTSQFVIIIPCSLIRNPRPARVLLDYGHGLFGSRSEVFSHKYAILANEFDWIWIASDWFGMASFDVLAMAKILIGDMQGFVGVPESTLQGFIDKALVLRTITNQMARNDPLLRVNDVRLLQVEDNTTGLAYYGNSQGGILGGGYFGFNPDIHRALLGVPGTPYALLLSRSRDFEEYSSMLSLSLYTWRHQRIAITLMGQLWDRGETAGWLSEIHQPGKKQVLIHAAIGDAQVTTLGAHIMARSINASFLSPATRPIYGIPEYDAPLASTQNAIVEWLYADGAIEQSTNLPAVGEDTHECPRTEIRGHQQMKLFFEQGIIDQFCDGPCISPHACPDF